MSENNTANIEGKENVKLEAQPTQTVDDIYREFMQAFTTLQLFGLFDAETATTAREIIREGLHWAYMPKGTHMTPSEIVLASIKRYEQDALAQVGVGQGNPDKPIKYDA